ncbi:MAG: MFS transporter [Gammaproteobacteria bacterium]|nr:MFS transporter [Gammaproteobacteria bacterium]
MTKIRRWLVMGILSFSGGIIFMLPFLREVYYIPMQEAFGYDHHQLGVIMSVFGTVSLIMYFPGGWLADRYSSRKLMSSALIATGLGGFYFSGYPSYQASILLHAFWGVTISLVFWCAMIKVTRAWAPAEEQGRAFGILESGRGIAELLSSTVFLAIFAWLGSNAQALSQVIILFALTNIVLGILAWFIFEENTQEESVSNEKKVTLKDVIEVLKLPAVWLITIVVMTAYSAYWGSFYFTPCATDVYALSVVLGGAVGVGKMWLKPVAALGAGFIADKFGVANSVFAFFILMSASFFVFGIMPGGEAFLVLMLINATIASLAVFALRGIYFALLQEGGIAPAVTGTATGVISAIGFTPDAWMPLVGGYILQNYPGADGYRYFFLLITGLCLIGTVAAYIIMRRTQHQQRST